MSSSGGGLAPPTPRETVADGPEPPELPDLSEFDGLDPEYESWLAGIMLGAELVGELIAAERYVLLPSQCRQAGGGDESGAAVRHQGMRWLYRVWSIRCARRPLGWLGTRATV